MQKRAVYILILAIFVLTACNLFAALGTVTPAPAEVTAPPTAQISYETPVVPVVETQAAAETAPATASPTSSAETPAGTESPQVATEAAPTAAASPGPVLSENGPWLAFDTSQGLVVSNADGSNPVPLQVSISRPAGELVASPHGWLAFMLASSQGNPPLDVSLGLMHLPQAQVNNASPLLSKDIQSKMGGPERPPEAAVALTEPGALRWSPDGRYLAFVAAIDGPSSDLYTYDTQTGKITRLTDGPTETASLNWSPDSRWIVHQAVQNFGAGAGWQVESVWAAAADGSDNRLLYQAKETTGEEIFAGWAGPDTIVVYSSTPQGMADLRAVNLASGKILPLYTGHFQAAAADPQSGLTAFTLDSPTAQQENEKPGVYLIPPGGQSKLMIGGSWDRVEWSQPAGFFLAHSTAGELATIPMQGDTVRYPQENWGGLSPDGKWLAAWGNAQFDPQPGVRLYNLSGKLQSEVTKDSVNWVLWRPDSAGLFYITAGNALYYLSLPSGQPQLVAENVNAGRDGGIAWVNP